MGTEPWDSARGADHPVHHAHEVIPLTFLKLSTSQSGIFKTKSENISTNVKR